MHTMDDIDDLCRKAVAARDYREASAAYGEAVRCGDYETAQLIVDGVRAADGRGVMRETDNPDFLADTAECRRLHEKGRARRDRLSAIVGELRRLYDPAA